MEVIVAVSSRSSDGSAAIARAALTSGGLFGTVIVVDGGTIPENLNAALAVARGDIIVRADTRSRLVPSHIRVTADRLTDPTIVAIGGWMHPVSDGGGEVARGIARVHRNRWAMGGARYRSNDGTPETDTVYLGGYRRADLVAAGGWDERLAVNEDYDLHRRLAKIGTVWCERDLQVDWLAPRQLGPLFAKFHRYGRGKVRYWRVRSERPVLRQLVSLATPPVAVLGLAGMWISTARATRRRRAAGATIALAASGLVILDTVGGGRSRAGVRERALASLASALIAAGWWTGVGREWAAGTIRRGADD